MPSRSQQSERPRHTSAAILLEQLLWLHIFFLHHRWHSDLLKGVSELALLSAGGLSLTGPSSFSAVSLLFLGPYFRGPDQPHSASQAAASRQQPASEVLSSS